MKTNSYINISVDSLKRMIGAMRLVNFEVFSRSVCNMLIENTGADRAMFFLVDCSKNYKSEEAYPVYLIEPPSKKFDPKKFPHEIAKELAQDVIESKTIDLIPNVKENPSYSETTVARQYEKLSVICASLGQSEYYHNLVYLDSQTKAFGKDDRDRVAELINGVNGVIPLGLENLERQRASLETIVGHSESVQKIKELIVKIADSDSPVLIYGKTGTGKEGVARTIHQCGKRNKKPFIVLDCGSISPTLLEGELFGHEKGSFTGASALKIGCFEAANGGTLFIDELQNMSLEMQAKFLRAIQEKTIKRIGGNEEISVNVRIVAATNESLEKLRKDRKLREDLYYRLNVIRIEVPPLQERKKDIPELIEHFLAKKSREPGKTKKKFSPELIEYLQNLEWPGNIRELENAIWRIYEITENRIIDKKKWLEICEGVGEKDQESPISSVKELTERCCQELVEGKISEKEVMQRLGLGRSTVYERRREYLNQKARQKDKDE